MEGSLLDQGLALMLIGMGTVFIFLTSLVFATKGMSALAGRWQGPETAVAVTGTVGPANNSEVVAAITAAIAQHRAGAAGPAQHARPEQPK